MRFKRLGTFIFHLQLQVMFNEGDCMRNLKRPSICKNDKPDYQWYP